MACAGITSIADLILQSSLYEGSGPGNVLKSFRPVSMGSATASIEGGCAQWLLNMTAELAAIVTPYLFRYH